MGLLLDLWQLTLPSSPSANMNAFFSGRLLSFKACPPPSSALQSGPLFYWQTYGHSHTLLFAAWLVSSTSMEPALWQESLFL